MPFRKLIGSIAFIAAMWCGSAMAGQELQVGADAMVSTVTAQRTFAGILPSARNIMPWTNSSLGSQSQVCPAGWEVWAAPFMRFDDRDSESRAFHGVEFRQYGVGAGLTKKFGNAFLGFAIGYDHRKTKNDDIDRALSSNYQSGEVKGDALHTALYGGFTFDTFFVDAYAGFSRTWNDAKIVNSNMRFSGDNADNVYSVGLTLGKAWDFACDWRLVTSAGIDYSHAKTSSYSIALDGTTYGWSDSRTYNQTQIPLMASLSRAFSGGSGVSWVPEVRGGWIPQLGSDRATAIGRYVGIPEQQRIRSAKMGNHGLLGAGLRVNANNRCAVGVDYDFRFSGDYTSHVISASLGISF